MKKNKTGQVKYKTLEEFMPLKGKKILVRVDLNNSMIGGKPDISDRMKAHAATIRKLCNEGAAVAVLAHQGRPGDKDFTSFRKHANVLNSLVKISYVNDIFGKKAVKAVKNLNPGKALLLENVRFAREEFQPPENNQFVNTLAPFFDLFVLDALSVAHRDEASVTGFMHRLPSCMGPVMEREMENIQRLAGKKFTVCLGGLKIDDYFGLIEHGLKTGQADKILTCGALGELFLMAKGVKLGAKEKFLKERGLLRLLPDAKKLLSKYRDRIELPVDVAAEKDGKRVELGVRGLPTRLMIYDIGSMTAERYAQIIRRAPSIFVKGTPGAFEKSGFETGTRAVFSAVAGSKGFSLIGGGDSSTAFRHLGMGMKRVGYVSLSGGALLKLLAGQRLPGLEYLKYPAEGFG